MKPLFLPSINDVKYGIYFILLPREYLGFLYLDIPESETIF
jgi:hypothetical protein